MVYEPDKKTKVRLFAFWYHVMRLLITRPAPDGEALANRLQAAGHQTLLSPVMEIVCRPFDLPPRETLSGLVITSRNALRCLEQQRTYRKLVDLPVFAVGESTAAKALSLGFRKVLKAAGRADSLPGLVAEYPDLPSTAPLWYPAARQKAFDLVTAMQQAGFRVKEQIVYESREIPHLPEAIAKAFEASGVDGVLLLSARSARLFAELIRSRGLEQNLATVTCYCLSQNVARAAGELNWQKILVATRPDIENLIDLTL